MVATHNPLVKPMLRKPFQSLFIIVSVMLIQLLTYQYLFKPLITSWGASNKELSSPMAGDSQSQTIISTRAISINASKQAVWKRLTQLGADRAGFYSYGFIERALGYKTRDQATAKLSPSQITKGEIVRGSIDEESAIIPYNFPVLYVKAEDTFVLGNWGTFSLTTLGDNKTRLTVRTQEPNPLTPTMVLKQAITAPFHYIMERRMLLGIKEHAQHDHADKFTQTNDILWLSFIMLSALLPYALVFVGSGLFQRTVLPCICGVAWLAVLFLLNPIALYSAGLFVTESLILLHHCIRGKCE